MQNKRLIIIFSVITVILLVPFIAMKFTPEVNWAMDDFLIGGALLYGTGLLCEFILRKVKATRTRYIMCAVALFILALVWAELAVGIFGTPFAGT